MNDQEKIIQQIHDLALQDKLGRNVDLLTPAGISPKIRPYIRAELKLIYENPG